MRMALLDALLVPDEMPQRERDEEKVENETEDENMKKGMFLCCIFYQFLLGILDFF